MVALFVDMKAAFDSDRGVLIKTMRKRDVRDGLVRKVGELE